MIANAQKAQFAPRTEGLTLEEHARLDELENQITELRLALTADNEKRARNEAEAKAIRQAAFERYQAAGNEFFEELKTLPRDQYLQALDEIEEGTGVLTGTERVRLAELEQICALSPEIKAMREDLERFSREHEEILAAPGRRAKLKPIQDLMRTAAASYNDLATELEQIETEFAQLVGRYEAAFRSVYHAGLLAEQRAAELQQAIGLRIPGAPGSGLRHVAKAPIQYFGIVAKHVEAPHREVSPAKTARGRAEWLLSQNLELPKPASAPRPEPQKPKNTASLRAFPQETKLVSDNRENFIKYAR